MNSRLMEVSEQSKTAREAKRRLEVIDEEGVQYTQNAERKCPKIKSGRIPFSPESSIWIRRRQVYYSLLKYRKGKIRNRSNLRRSAQHCGIQRP